jgi:hypothetical protein
MNETYVLREALDYYWKEKVDEVVEYEKTLKA